MATARRLSSSVDSARRAVFRLPLGSQVAIAIAFVCSYLLYGRIAGHPAPTGWTLAAGIASFLALFLQLRLVDDLDDLERDHPVGRWGASRRSALQARLVMGLIACMASIALLNMAWLDALIAAAFATVLTLAGPFGFKRLFPTRLAFGSIVFEGAPLSVFAYVYFFWRDAGGAELPVAVPVCVGGLFWAGYELWKFSRKVHTDAMQPYFLSSPEIRLSLNVLLGLALAANVGLAHAGGLSAVYTAYAVLLPIAFLVWVNATWPSTLEARARARAARPLWSGLTFVGAVELGLLLELAHAFGAR